MCETGCAAKYKVEKLKQKLDDAKKIEDSLHKTIETKTKAAKELKDAEQKTAI
jgi:cell division septum initiation protein DivIVA